MHAKPISPLEHYLARVHLLPDDIHFLLDVYECKLHISKHSLLTIWGFVLDEKFQWNASKFAILLEYENPCSFFRFSFRATLFFP